MVTQRRRTAGVSRNRVVFIRPENVRIGDTIRARFNLKDGLTVDICGTVAKREYDHQWRVYYTREGGEIYRWMPEHKAPRITLLSRKERQETLPGMEGKL